MCRHHINTLIIEHINSERDYDTILGCQDSCIRIIQGSNLAMEITVDAPVTSILSMGNVGKSLKVPKSIVYGTGTGAIGLLDVLPSG